MDRRAALALVVPSLALVCCSQSAVQDPDAGPPPKGILCTHEMRPGIVVEVRDARTGLPAASGATGVITEGGYTETLVLEGGMTPPHDPPLQLVGAWERPGLFDVTVRKEGYAPWSQSGVRVTADECHVLEVLVQAALEPAP